MPSEASPAPGPRPGKGLDVGTSNLVCAREEADGSVTVSAIRNAFLDVEADPFTRSMLSKLKIQCVQREDRLIIVGDTAFELANVFNRETRRPMQSGMLSPQEANALPIERLLIARLLGAPAPEERCVFSVPADPIDTAMNVAYHRGVMSELLAKLGYAPLPLVEGYAVVLAELEQEAFTGIGISCGGGMFNACIAYKSVPVVSYATSRGGDWVDQNAAAAVGSHASRLCALKERGMDLHAPKSTEEEAIAIYYRQLIEYTLHTLKLKFEATRDVPSFPEPVTLVCSGGSALAGGFIDAFREQFQKARFPIPVKEIRLAAEPLNTVAQGCLIAARAEPGQPQAPVQGLELAS